MHLITIALEEKVEKLNHLWGGGSFPVILASKKKKNSACAHRQSCKKAVAQLNPTLLSDCSLVFWYHLLLLFDQCHVNVCLPDWGFLCFCEVSVQMLCCIWNQLLKIVICKMHSSAPLELSTLSNSVAYQISASPLWHIGRNICFFGNRLVV